MMMKKTPKMMTLEMMMTPIGSHLKVIFKSKDVIILID